MEAKVEEMEQLKSEIEAEHYISRAEENDCAQTKKSEKLKSEKRDGPERDEVEKPQSGNINQSEADLSTCLDLQESFNNLKIDGDDVSFYKCGREKKDAEEIPESLITGNNLIFRIQAKWRKRGRSSLKCSKRQRHPYHRRRTAARQYITTAYFEDIAVEHDITLPTITISHDKSPRPVCSLDNHKTCPCVTRESLNRLKKNPSSFHLQPPQPRRSSRKSSRALKRF